MDDQGGRDTFPRTLRSQRRRALIWRSQDGICAICHKPMRPDEDWEIDHVEPWRLTHRTNIHELQATHRRCNRLKGGHMATEIKRYELLRKGQRGMIEMIASRVGRTDTTALVAACRYGKSDTARVAILKLWGERRICGSLGLSPGETLRDQLGDPTKWNKAIRRYKITGVQPRIATLEKMKLRPNANGEIFISATIQLIQQNVDDVCAWIESETHQTALPFLVFIDECHTGSEGNEWGKVVPKLITAGAHVVLLTATPDREDGVRIPGFRFDVVEEAEVTLHRVRDHEDPRKIWVEQLHGMRKKLRLVPDYEVTFAEAWAESDGDVPILCKISRVTFDVELRLVGVFDEDGTRLSHLSDSKARKYLGKIVRNPMVVRDGCRRLIRALDWHRARLLEIQAIVYCGNDIGDASDNQHAEDIKAELLRQCKEAGRAALDIQIATADANGREVIEGFQGSEETPGIGDVLIVKQMAGLGLDLPTVKVGLDLSPTRSYAALVQRMFRPATPYDGDHVATWITPDDIVSAYHFERVVTAQGGEAHTSDLTLISRYEKERGEGPEQKTVFVDGVADGKFGDSDGRQGGAETWQRVESVFTRLPKIASVYTAAEVAEVLDVWEEDEQAGAEGDVPETVRDTSAAAKALRAEIGAIAKEAVRFYREVNDIPYAQYGASIEAVWAQAKRDANWPIGVKVDKSDDLEALQRLKTAMDALRTHHWRSLQEA